MNELKHKWVKQVKEELEDVMIKNLGINSPHLDNWWGKFWEELEQ